MRSTLTTRLAAGIIALLLVATIARLGFAQEQPAQPQPYSISYVQVKPGMSLEFEALVKNLLPLVKKAGVTNMSIWKTAQFGESDKYIMAIPVKSLAEFDAPDDMLKLLGPEGIALLLSNVQRTISSERTFLLMGRPDLGVPIKEGYEPKLGVLLTASVAPGRTEEFEKGMKEAMAVIAKTNVKGVLAGQVSLGGNMNEYTALVLRDSFADMEKNTPEMQKALAAANLAPMTGIVVHMKNEVMRMIPELSIQEAAQ